MWLCEGWEIVSPLLHCLSPGIKGIRQPSLLPSTPIVTGGREGERGWIRGLGQGEGEGWGVEGSAMERHCVVGPTAK